MGTAKFTKKKLYLGETILVNNQILRWRKYRKEPYVRQTKQKLGSPKQDKPKNVKDKNFFGDTSEY